MSRPRRLFIIFGCAMLVAGAGVLAFRYLPGSRAAAPKAVPAVPVTIVPVVTKSVPVKLYAAVEDAAVHFHLLHASDRVPLICGVERFAPERADLKPARPGSEALMRV